MPFDGRKFNETKPDVFSLEGLIAWLETQPPEQEYDYWNCQGGCLIGLYARANGIEKWMTLHKMTMPGRPLVWGSNDSCTFGGLAALTPRTYGAALKRAREALVNSRAS